MDDDSPNDADLQALAAQRLQRPDYRRVISQELTSQGDEEITIQGSVKNDEYDEPRHTSQYSALTKGTRRAAFQELPFYNIDGPIDGSAHSLHASCNLLSDPIPHRESNFRFGSDIRLTDLCLDALHGSSRGHHLPYWVRKQVSGHGLRSKLKRIQLRWGHRVLGLAERTYKDGVYEKDRGDWNLKMYPVPLRNLKENGHDPGDFQVIDHNKYGILPLAALSMLVNLMLPTHLNEDLLERLVASSTVQEAMVRSIRNKLFKRYPTVCGELFHIALPFTWWMRGLYAKAGEEFAEVAQTMASTSNGPMAEVMLREAGRMCIESGQLDEACRLFYASIDLEKRAQDVAFLAASMCARAYCTGKLTQSKFHSCQQQCTHALGTTSNQHGQRLWWARANPRPLFENRLCFFTGFSADSDWRLETLKDIRQHGSVAGDLDQHRASLEALLGDDAPYSPVSRYMNSGDGVDNLWAPLATRLQVQQTNVRPLRMVWRTPLHYSGMDTEWVFTGPQGQPAKLRFDGEHLIAETSTLIPFRQSIILDPHTGQILPWICDCRQEIFKRDEGYPRLIRVFDNVQGASVDLLVCHVPVEKPRNPCTYYSTQQVVNTSMVVELFRTDSSGNTQKLDIYKLARETTLNEKRKEIQALFNEGSIKWEVKRELEEILHKKYTSGKTINLNTILEEKEARTNKGEKTKSKQKEQKHKTKGKQWAKNQKPSISLHTMQVHDFYTFSQTIVIHVKINDVVKAEGHLVIFVNCATSKSFLEPKVHMLERPCTSYVYPAPRHMVPHFSYEQDKHHFPDTHFWIINEDKRPFIENVEICGFQVYNTDGEVITLSVLSKYDIRSANLCHMVFPQLFGFYGGTLIHTDPMGKLHEFELSPPEQNVSAHLRLHGTKAFILSDHGFSMVHIPTPEMCSFFLTANQHSLGQFSDGEVTLFGTYDNMDVLAHEEISPGSARGVIKDGVTRYAVGIGHFLLLIETDDNSSIASIVFHEPLVGRPEEVFFISESRGFLVAVSHGDVRTRHEVLYRETIFHYSHQGTLLSLLPFMGPGPRKFTLGTVHTEENEPDEKTTRIFFFDGHESIACFDVERNYEDA